MRLRPIAFITLLSGVIILLVTCGGGTATPPQEAKSEGSAAVSVSSTVSSDSDEATTEWQSQSPLPVVRTPTINGDSGGTTTELPAGRFFPMGVFEDGNIVGGDTTKFEAMISDLRSHGLDSVLFANNSTSRDEPLLNISDPLHFKVFFTSAHELYQEWWPDEVPATRETALSVIAPIVAQLAPHPSLKGYSVIDEPSLDLTNKVALATQVFRELDPSRLTLPVLIGVDRVGPIFETAQPDVMLIDVYPVGYANPLCDFTMTGFGYDELDFVSYIRAVAYNKPAETPLWVILQTHSFGDGGPFSLREPVPAELRAQNWLAIGEGATGIFWFVYSTQQGWIGLADNPALYEEVTTLAGRVGPLRDLLMGLQKAEDRFSVAGQQNAYVSTLASADGADLYVVAVNRDCESSQMLSIGSSMLQGQLRDLESGQIYAMDEPVPFQAGDGKIFELVDGAELGVPSIDPDYDLDVETWWAGHRFNPESLNFDPVINSPQPLVDVASQFGGDIQAALDALPPGGGTLYLPPGTYILPEPPPEYDNDSNHKAAIEITGTSNVHFIGPAQGEAVIKYPTPTRGTYNPDVMFDIMRCDRQNSYTNPDCYTDLVRDFYFKNITFDGAGISLYAVLFRAARDIVFDNCVFQNFRDPAEYHRGLVSAAAWVDNIWFRDCHFVGNERYAIYLDGTHGSGVVNTRIESNFGSGGLLFLTNDDLTQDVNGNGVFDPNEIRTSAYVIVDSNTFAQGLWAAITIHGRNSLIKNNTVEGPLQGPFVGFYRKSSIRWPDLTYEYYGNRVIGNTTKDLPVFAEFGDTQLTCVDNCARLGKYTVRGNVVEDAFYYYEEFIRHYGSIDGPNVIEYNCVNDPDCSPSARTLIYLPIVLR